LVPDDRLAVVAGVAAVEVRLDLLHPPGPADLASTAS